MASLLPNGVLQIADNDSGTVLVSGQSSQGLENRRKILATGRAGDRTTAVKAEDLMGMDKDQARALVRDHDVVYVYHNLIDAIGDKRDSEERVFEAAEDTIEEIVRLVKKLNGANANNMIVTSDHGFIYQHRPIEESDFSSAPSRGGRDPFPRPKVHPRARSQGQSRLSALYVWSKWASKDSLENAESRSRSTDFADRGRGADLCMAARPFRKSLFLSSR